VKGSHQMNSLLLASALALVSIEAHALADGPACAMVKQTPDGFLNLRADFSMSGKIIAKLRPGDRLYDTATGHFTVIKGALYFNERPCLPLQPVDYGPNGRD
jgi:hypothetical protein